MEAAVKVAGGKEREVSKGASIVDVEREAKARANKTEIVVTPEADRNTVGTKGAGERRPIGSRRRMETGGSPCIDSNATEVGSLASPRSDRRSFGKAKEWVLPRKSKSALHREAWRCLRATGQ